MRRGVQRKAKSLVEWIFAALLVGLIVLGAMSLFFILTGSPPAGGPTPVPVG